MVVIDTSAWIEYFRDGDSYIVESVDRCLMRNTVAIGDLISCEVMQGIRSPKHYKEICSIFASLPRYEMVGFPIAERAAYNYRMLRSRGVTIRKTIDVLIGTFCVENGMQLLHNDRDFDAMANYLGLSLFSSK